MKNTLLTIVTACAIIVPMDITNSFAANHNVSSKTQFTQAIAKAEGWDTITLAAWDYWDNTLYGKNYTSKVTIIGAWDATIFGKTNIVRSSNIAFKNINFSRELKWNERVYTPIITVSFSNDIKISENTISSSDDNDVMNDLTGVSARWNNRLTITGNSFTNLYKWLSALDWTDTDISDNSFDTIRLVGVELGRNSVDSEITNNNFMNFYPCGTNSPESCTRPAINISLWNSGGKQVLSKTQISGNTSLLGKWSFSQFIIARSNNSTFKISDLTISQNSLYNNHINGIYVNSVTNTEISNNSLIQWNFSAYNLASNWRKPYIRVYNSSNIEVKQNLAFGIQDKNNTSISKNQNILWQRSNKSANSHISKLIFQDALWSQTILGSLAPKEGSLLDLGNNKYIWAQWYYEQEEIEREPSIYQVTNNATFTAALNKVQWWDSIILDDWNYWDITIYWKIFDEGVKIQSKNTKKVIISKLQIVSSSHLHFSWIIFDHPRRANDYDWSKVVYVNQSNNIWISHSEFRGSTDNNFTNDIEWFGARASNNLHLANNEFHNLEKWAVFDDTHSVIFSHNDFHDIAVDWVAFGNNAVDIQITHNTFTNFRPCDIFDTATCKKHPDFIQMWNNRWTKANENITIANNSLTRWEGWVTQWIFIQANNTTYPNKNFTISDNTISTSHIHWITIVDWSGITIKDNSVTTSPKAVTSPKNPNKWTINPRIRFYNITSGSITNNTTNYIDLINSPDAIKTGNTESMRP